ncbi:MAG: hypothetical protein K0U93_13930 [Gammaproteobacteria bacterium]|nr:hypothetical protein [Gammaproteobacteria bacterium]
MAIRYYANDPAAASAIEISPSLDRTGARLRLRLPAGPPEDLYDETDAGFVHWQARESGLRCLETWDRLSDRLARWQNDAHELELDYNAGIGLQASYDRQSIRMFRWESPATTFVGASTDAVAHEIGHALLDAMRPDLWQSFYPEVVSFHEAFADCFALLVALLDGDQRAALFTPEVPGHAALKGGNSISKFAESVAHSYGQSFSPRHPSAFPRDANNQLRWAFPHLLPAVAPGVRLSQEPHSFSRVFSGCFYDLIHNIYQSKPATSAGLEQAALSAGALLLDAIENAPEGLQFFQSIGRAMVLADREDNGGLHQRAVADAFNAHGILLGSSALVAPVATLDGTARRTRGGSVGLNARSREDLRQRLHAPKRTRFRFSRVRLGARRLLKAAYKRYISVGKLHRQLRGVRVALTDAVLLDVVDKRHTVLEGIPDAKSCEEHTLSFVETMIDNGMLMLGRQAVRRGRKRSRAATEHPDHALASFSVRTVNRQRVITRVRYACHSRQR